MREDSGGFKDCPSCGSRIAAGAARCPLCQAALGTCQGCGAWIVEGTACLDCGRTTVIRARAARAPGPEPEPVAFKGSALGLIPFLALRGGLGVACAILVLYAVAGSPLDPITWWVCEYLVSPLRVSPWALWAGVGGLVLAMGATGTLVRRYRLSRTQILGRPVSVRFRAGPLLLDALVTVVVLGLTGGLGFPWLLARYRRTFYRQCRLPGGPETRLDFRGTGEEVLGRLLISVLILPLAVATAGLGLGLISWIWLTWEHSNLRIPGRPGEFRRLRLHGSFAAYLGWWALGWVLSVATAGIYRPWAKASEWRWVARNSELV